MTSVRIGNMTPENAEDVKEKVENESYMNFNVTAGVIPGPARCVTVHTDVGDVTEDEVKDMIMFLLATH